MHRRGFLTRPCQADLLVRRGRQEDPGVWWQPGKEQYHKGA